MQGAQSVSVTIKLEHVTEHLHTLKDPSSKYEFLKEIFKLHRDQQPWLHKIKFSISTASRQLTSSNLDEEEKKPLLERFNKLHQKIEQKQVEIGHPPKRHKRLQPEPAHDPQSSMSSTTPKVSRTNNRLTSTSLSTPFRSLLSQTMTASPSQLLGFSMPMQSVGSPIPAAALTLPINTTTTDSEISQLEMQIVLSIWERAKNWQCADKEVDIRKAIDHLIYFYNASESIRKETAYRIGLLYFKISDFDQAKIYFSRSEKTYTTTFFSAYIAFKNGENDECIGILKPLFSIPSNYYDKEQFIDNIPIILFQSENEKSLIIKALRLMAEAFEKKGEMVVTTRFREIAVSLGDENMRRYLTHSLHELAGPAIAKLMGENEAFRREVLRTRSMHRDNPAFAMARSLIMESKNNGYITTSDAIFRTIVADIVANEALSRYYCSFNNASTESLCSTVAIQLCDKVKETSPNHPLIAWIFASMHREHPPSNINELAQIAMEAGFSDPRISGVSLFPVKQDEQPASIQSIHLTDDDIILIN